MTQQRLNSGPGNPRCHQGVRFQLPLTQVRRQIYPGRGGLITKTTKGRRRRAVPIIEALRSTLERLTTNKRSDDRLIVGPRGDTRTEFTHQARERSSPPSVDDRRDRTGLTITWTITGSLSLAYIRRLAHDGSQAKFNAGITSWPLRTTRSRETLTAGSHWDRFSKSPNVAPC